MTNRNDATVRPPDSDEPELTLEHVTIENESAPDECAIFPQAATEDELLTNWITAYDGSFVDLESMR